MSFRKRYLRVWISKNKKSTIKYYMEKYLGIKK